MRERLLTIADLASEPGRPGRWIYCRSGILRLSRTADFPEPIALVSRGRIKVWRLAHLVDYERRHPEVLLSAQRYRKQRGWRVERPVTVRCELGARPWPWCDLAH